MTDTKHWPGRVYDLTQENMNKLILELEEAQKEIARLETILRIAAGLVSTLPEFANKHPQEAYDFIVSIEKEDREKAAAAAAADAAADATRCDDGSRLDGN